MKFHFNFLNHYNNLLKPCNNFLISDFSVRKQGFNLAKHNSMKIKQYKRAVKCRFLPCETSL